MIIDARMINSSGIGRYISELLPYIISEFNDVVLLGNPSELKKYNTDIIEFSAPIYSIKEQIKYPKIIPEAALFWSPHFNIPLISIKAKKRIATIHDAFHLAYFNQLSLSQRIYAKAVINTALLKSDKIITVSNFSKNELLKYTNLKYNKKIEVIYNGVSEIDAENTDSYAVSENTYFLFVGNVKPHKNLKNALLAFKVFIENLPENYEKPHFKIVGKQEGFITGNNEELSNILKEDELLKKEVQFTGFVSDKELKKLYKEALVLVFPSYYEGFGLPPLEAMNYGCPVIAADAASLPEICGNAVLYFNPFDINDIVDKMNEIYKSAVLRKKLILNGNNRVKAFTWGKSAEEHIKIFKKLMG
jgi:glycosyltransferase involved in cell wall biosynthesis